MKNVLLVLQFIIIMLLSSCYFFSMNALPKGKFVEKYNSPNNHYTLNIYLDNGGATVDFAIRGELVDNQKHTKKNIYWAYHESSANVDWLNDYTVDINNIVLDVRKEVYDYRQHENDSENYNTSKQ